MRYARAATAASALTTLYLWFSGPAAAWDARMGRMTLPARMQKNAIKTLIESERGSINLFSLSCRRTKMQKILNAVLAAALVVPLLSVAAYADVHGGGGHGGGIGHGGGHFDGGHGFGGALGHIGGGLAHVGVGGHGIGGGFGHGGGAVFGAPYYYGSYRPYSYIYAYPPPVVVNGGYLPPEGGLIQPDAPTPQENWYHCDDPEGYYPYVRSCNQQWQPVPAMPPGAPPGMSSEFGSPNLAATEGTDRYAAYPAPVQTSDRTTNVSAASTVNPTFSAPARVPKGTVIRRLEMSSSETPEAVPDEPVTSVEKTIPGLTAICSSARRSCRSERTRE